MVSLIFHLHQAFCHLQQYHDLVAYSLLVGGLGTRLGVIWWSSKCNCLTRSDPWDPLLLCSSAGMQRLEATSETGSGRSHSLLILYLSSVYNHRRKNKPTSKIQERQAQWYDTLHSTVNYSILHKLLHLMFTSSTHLDALPYPNTEIWTYNVNVSGKVSCTFSTEINFKWKG